MRRIRYLVLTLVPGLAAAESRLDTGPIPELMRLEPIHHLDRGIPWGERSSGGIAGSIGLGYGKHGDDRGLVGEGALMIGKRMKQLVAAATSEVVAEANALVRGRHTGWLELRTGKRRGDDDLTGIVSVGTVVEHGEARGLAPVYLGPGRRDHAAANADVLIGLDPDDDMILGALVQVDGSVTRWLDAPALDRAYRGALGLGVAFAPNDAEIPAGRIDVLRARVEHANIQRPLRAAGVLLRDTQVRTIEVMTGVHELAGHIDHELLFAVTAQLGGVWIEADASEHRLANTGFKMEVGGHFKWAKRRHGRRELGLALAREPGTSPDGQHLTTDWRLQMVSGAEDARFVLSARGGISWVSHVAGGEADPGTMKRYGSHLEAFAKLGLGLELGGYHVITYEPRVAGDPWSTPRAFATEIGVLARWRPSTYGR